MLDRLERGGWVIRERDPSDRRAAGAAATELDPSLSSSAGGVPTLDVPMPVALDGTRDGPTIVVAHLYKITITAAKPKKRKPGSKHTHH